MLRKVKTNIIKNIIILEVKENMDNLDRCMKLINKLTSTDKMYLKEFFLGNKNKLKEALYDVMEDDDDRFEIIKYRVGYDLYDLTTVVDEGKDFQIISGPGYIQADAMDKATYEKVMLLFEDVDVQVTLEGHSSTPDTYDDPADEDWEDDYVSDVNLDSAYVERVDVYGDDEETIELTDDQQENCWEQLKKLCQKDFGYKAK